MNRIERLLSSPFGALLARPWFDRAALHFLKYWFFPLSRLWAAADGARGSVDEFFAQVPMAVDPALRRKVAAKLQRFENLRAASETADAEWERAFFGIDNSGVARLQRVESERLARRVALNQARRLFLFLRRHPDVRPVRWGVPSPVAVAALYARLIKHPAGPFEVPSPLPEVFASQKIPGHQGLDYWLRFRSPSERMNDQVVARVQEPADVSNPPTLIFLHGIGVEFDHWHGMIDEVGELIRRGFRVVRPEAPWHGRRNPTGCYGGEKFISTMPLGTLQFFGAQVRETAILMDWCRRNTNGPVALGGSSLGAHVARVAGAWANIWPPRLHPDAMLLVTPCGSLEDAAVEGAFAEMWGVEQATRIKGWGAEITARWLALIDPPQAPVVAPDRIVTVLGTLDNVTPYQSGRDVLARLGIPSRNVFAWKQGHFSLPLSLVRNRAPMQRFQEILDGLA